MRRFFHNLLRGLVRYTGSWFVVGAVLATVAWGGARYWAAREPENIARQHSESEEQAARLLAVMQAFPVEKTGAPLVNVHEHLENRRRAERIIALMELTGVTQTVLLGSPDQTLYPGRNRGFVRYDRNNAEVIAAAKRHPDKLTAFCTLNPSDPQHLTKLRQCLADGAKGLKLYSGHGLFYTIPLNDPSLDPLYAFLEEERVPVLWHINGGKYLHEFEDVLLRYPEMNVVCPHFCLLSSRTATLKRLLETYPNLIFDISFGHPQFLRAGLQRISEKNDVYRELFATYPDRFLFGADIVITGVKKTEDMYEFVAAYRHLLERDEFDAHFTMYDDKTVHYKGLVLPQAILDRVYYKNWREFLER